MLNENKIVEIYESLNKELFVYIFRFTRSHEASEDLLHDCFANLIDYSDDHDIDEKTIRAFLYKTAHNLSSNFLKRGKRINFSTIEDDDTIISKDDNIEQLEFEELNNKIYALLDEVDDTSRSIFVMKKELNLSMEEIAKNIGKSERTVRRKLTSVIDFLGNNLKKAGFLSLFIFLMSLFFILFVL
ncbi:MAG: sigma-70 family RNA polymerase sigma factor [bacterium]|nr:sigma-70 family RNA polymerase sigma factor [bacterium]